MTQNKAAWSQTTNAQPDTNMLPVQQVTTLGNVNDYIMLSPYGMHYNAPTDTLCYNLCNEKRIAMATSDLDRITIDSGEVIFFHPTTKTRIHLQNDGAIAIENESGTKITMSGADVNIECTSFTVTSPAIELDGDVSITGDLQVDGITTLGASGDPIARVGDSVQVTGVSIGTSTAVGTITSGSPANTSN